MSGNQPTTVLECLQRNTVRCHSANEIAVTLTPPEHHNTKFRDVFAQVQVDLARLLKEKKIEEHRWRDFEHPVYTIKEH